MSAIEWSASLLSLSACFSARKYKDADSIWLTLAEYFGNNFFFEVQAHNTDPQKALNSRILNLANRNNIRLIFGCDSHFIYPLQAIERYNYLLSKNIEYEEESGWYMDFPSGDEVLQRFRLQGILNPAQIAEAIDNTNIREKLSVNKILVLKIIFKICLYHYQTYM